MRRLNALVVGNANYKEASPLKNPVNDAKDIAEKLERGGFAITKLADASNRDMHKALKAFAKSCEQGEVPLFFFAGHGVQIDGINYLAAVDTPIDDQTDVEHGSLSLDEVIKRMERAGSPTNIIILDACRDNPWDRKWRGKPRGLAPVYAPRGTLIGFATSPGEFALDGKGRNGAYTSALLQHIDTPDVPIEAMFKRVRNSLSATTKGKQTSWEHTSLAGEFYFNLGAAARIDEYSPTAIKDGTFIPDVSKPSHLAIRELKSYNWYRQNPALEKLSAAELNGTDPDSLFVLGRNILQAASGSAHTALDWIRNFNQRMEGATPDTRKCILDGMLFEIFFNADGELRNDAKTNMFSEVFALQQFAEHKESFDFIASALTPTAHRFFVIPGKGHDVSVDVVFDKDEVVEAIMFGGKNILIQEDDVFGIGAETRMYEIRRQTFEKQLAEQMVVPRHLLKVTYSAPVSSFVRVPYGYEIVHPS